MSNGFGGSPGLALLTGLAKGVAQRDERKRAQAREDLIDERTRAQIDAARSTLRRNENEERRKKDADQRDATDRAARNASVMHIAGFIREESPELDDESAQAMARVIMQDRQQAARTVANIMFPPGQDETPMQAAQRDRLTLQIKQLQDQVDQERQLQNLSNAPEGERLRRVYLDGDETGTDIARRSALHAGFEPTAIDAYLDTLTPKDSTGSNKPTTEQKRAAQMRGAADAEQLIQEVGSLEQAISITQRAIQEADPNNPIIQAELDGMLRRLDQIRQNDEDSGSLSTREILRNQGG